MDELDIKTTTIIVSILGLIGIIAICIAATHAIGDGYCYVYLNGTNDRFECYGSSCTNACSQYIMKDRKE